MGAILYPKGKETITTTDDVVTIGTSAACTITINDPVAAAVHARIFQRDGLFVLEDAGSASGTWKNGVAVTEGQPLADGDVVVVGCSKITCKLTAADAGGKLELALKEKEFFFEISKSRQVAALDEAGKPVLDKDGKPVKKTVVGGDSERWVRDEVLFGRFAGLSPANLAAGVAALAVLVLVAFASMRARVLQPDDLHAGHAALFASDRHAPTSKHEEDCQEVADAQGCNACHDTFGGTPTEKCGECHAAILESKHPFRDDRHSEGPLASIPLAADMCAICHLDHLGREPGPGALKPTAVALAQQCEDCHGSPVPNDSKDRRLKEPPLTDHKVFYDAFPHSTHAELKCDVCHVKPERKEKLPGVKRDYASVAFETCMGCHAAEGGAYRRAPELERLMKTRVKPEHLARVTWHGSGTETNSKCLDCHAQRFEPDLRTTTTRRVDALTFNVQRRGHEELFAAHATVTGPNGKAQECSACHADGIPLQAGTAQDARFWHALHMPSVKPGNSAAALSSECLACHVELNDSKRLAGKPGSTGDSPADAIPYLGPDTQSCGRCHKDEKGATLVTKPNPPKAGDVVARHDFPHGIHVTSQDASLRAGCFTCHEFTQSDELFAARPTTRADSASCMPCHDNHKAVGGDGCALCHPSTSRGADLAYFGTGRPRPGTKRADDLEARRRKQRPDTTGFSHFTTGHDGDDCAACHTDTEKAKTIQAVQMPSEAGDKCWACHVQDKRQFHWRGEKLGASVGAAK